MLAICYALPSQDDMAQKLTLMSAHKTCLPILLQLRSLSLQDW